MKKIKKRKMLSIFVELKDSMLLFLVLVDLWALIGLKMEDIEWFQSSLKNMAG